MIVVASERDDGKLAVLVGLTEADLVDLLSGETKVVGMAPFGLPDGDLLIAAGPDNRSLCEFLAAAVPAFRPAIEAALAAADAADARERAAVLN